MENGGNDFVNRYTEVVGSAIVADKTDHPIVDLLTEKVDSFVNALLPGDHIPVKASIDLGLIKIGDEAGAVVADYTVPDKAGSWFFDPRSTVGTDIYTNSRYTPIRMPEWPLLSH